MKLNELISEAPIGQAIGKAVGKAAFGAGKQTGQAVDSVVATDKNIKAAGSAFNQGLGSGAKAATPKASKSAFDVIPDRDAKNILQNVINGKPLDQYQMSLIKKVYNSL